MDRLEKSIKDHDQISRTNIKIEDIDYKIAKGHIPFFKMIDSIGTSKVVVLDYFKNNYFYVSESLNKLFGFYKNKIPKMEHNWFRNRFHPKDYIINVTGIEARKFLAKQPVEKRKDYKITHDFRIRNDNDEWVRLIVQDYILELDKKGNIWLNMKLFDLSPIQDLDLPARAVFRNKITGKIIFSLEGEKDVHEKISDREKQVLNLIGSGLRSKEIAEQLFISSNTVNNHRKHIMDKLNVSNASEAVKYAVKLGII